MWRNWVMKPFICVSSGFIAQNIVGYICDIGYYLSSDRDKRNYLEYKIVERSKILAFWTGIVGSLVAMRYYKFEIPKIEMPKIEMPKLLKNE